MLEIIERLVRSWGNFIVEALLCYDTKKSWNFAAYYIGTLVYTLIHCYIHFWRVMLVSVAIVSTDSSMFMIVLTNNFAELKGTVFKKLDSKSLYPVMASDIVERVYLCIDVSIVLFRMLTSPQKSKMPFVEVAYWVSVMIFLEIVTDWFKYMCVIKFNQIEVSTLKMYKQIHQVDMLTARQGVDTVAASSPGRTNQPCDHPHKRLNFMPTPLAVIILVNIMLPNMVGSEPITLWMYRVLVFTGILLAKLIIDWTLIGSAAVTPFHTLPEKLLHVRCA